ncbi:hypothetical protein B0H14DRAFT_2589699 [Mycena olivaceomarginata]|nr:hypothetical protein B0H14DRAFT_2589699 [Mycena olivaceomarginata]
MSRASQSHTVHYMNIHGGVGGRGGEGGEQGGGGGAGEGPSINYAVGTGNITICITQDRSDNDKEIVSAEETDGFNSDNPLASEIEPSKASLALVCPPPSQIFQGRQDILEKMAKHFSTDPGQRHTYVLHGLGGSGKTQIALKFLDMMNRYQTPRFTKQFFINASSRQTLDTAFTNIAISQGIGKSSEDGSLWLISHVEEWMLLFDNADNPNLNLSLFSLDAHMETLSSPLGDMDETNAIDLLLLRAVKKKTIETTRQASEIVKELSCLPLAAIQAGAYISKFNCLPRFKQLSNVAARFLQLCSLLHHNNIPEAIFEQAAEWTTNDAGQEAQILLAARGFLQNFLSASGTWDQQCLMDIVAEIQGFKEAEHLDAMVLEEQKQLLGTDHPDTLWAMTNLDATYRQLGSGKQLLGADHPDTLRAMGNLAGTYGQLGRYKEAEPLESTVLEKWKQLLGGDHPDTLQAMSNLAATYHQLGRYKKAEELQDCIKNMSEDDRLCLVSPWMEAGDIMELITAKEPTFAECLSLILDIAFGLQYLHKETIVHGNLKANAFSLMLSWFNILVTPSDRACMVEFRLSRIAKAVNMGLNHSTVNAGMACYQASELFKATNLAQMMLCKVGFLEGLDRWKFEGGQAVFVPRRIKIQEEMKEQECERLVKLEEGKAVNM